MFAGSTSWRETSEPWTGMGRVAARALALHGYEVEVRTDTPGPVNPRFVADGRAELGATNPNILHDAFNVTGPFASEGRRDNLRAVATVCRPSWTTIAVGRDTRITDLAQIKERQLPVTMMLTAGDEVLEHYGMTRQDIVSYGGRIVHFSERRNARDIDVMIGNFYMAYTTVASAWVQALFARDWRFLDLPDAFIDQMVASGRGYPGSIPLGYAPGVDRDVKAIANPYLAIYTRDDAPDDFIGMLAQALDDNRDYFRESHLNLSSDARHVARHARIPFHPAALAYYQKQGYPTD